MIYLWLWIFAYVPILHLDIAAFLMIKENWIFPRVLIFWLKWHAKWQKLVLTLLLLQVKNFKVFKFSVKSCRKLQTVCENTEMQRRICKIDEESTRVVFWLGQHFSKTRIFREINYKCYISGKLNSRKIEKTLNSASMIFFREINSLVTSSVKLISRIFCQKSMPQHSVHVTVWKLRKFSLTHFRQKFRESNSFTK